MASIIEELISTLEQEKGIYEALIPIAEEKTKVIINNDLEALQSITDKEQDVVGRIAVLERKRAEVIVNIGTVINRNPGSLNIKTLVRVLDKQPEEQRRLSELHESLTQILKRLMDINGQNKYLIEQSLEMIEFNMNFIQSSQQALGGGYTKNASDAAAAAPQAGVFDKKQ